MTARPPRSTRTDLADAEGGSVDGRRRIKIVHCIGTMAIGGAEHQLVELITRLPPDRFEQHLVLFRAEGAFLERVRASGCDVVGLLPPRPAKRRRSRASLQLVVGVVRLLRHLVRIRPDIVHGQLDHANVIAVVAGRLTRVPVVVTSQLSLNRDRAASTRRQRVVNWAHRSATEVLANSAAVFGDLVAYSNQDAGRVRLIYNGVDLDKYTTRDPDHQAATRARFGIHADDRVIACVANLHPYKGHEDLVRAFARLDPAARGFALVLVGRDAGAEPRTRAVADELGVSDSVFFLGSVTGAEDLLAIAEIVVHPSHEEGFANAIIEAMSTGRPVVACDVGGNREAIVDGTTGLLVPPRNVKRLTAAMGELLDDHERASEMGRAGRRRAEERYGIDRMVDDFARWYGELVADAGGPGRARWTASYTRRR